MRSKDNGSSSYSFGGGFLSLLTVLFIGLKLTGFIDWSWWWALSPIWIPLAVIAFGLLLLGVIVLLTES